MALRKENAPYKLVVLGDGGVGKTALTMQLCLSHFVETYDPTIEDSYRKQVIIDHQNCALEILDTAGQEEYSALKDQWIRDGEGFVLVYAITSRTSYNRIPVILSQIERLKHPATPEDAVPFIIIGTKSDRVTEREVSYQEGSALAKKLNCEFFEASAKNNINVERAFTEAVKITRKARLAKRAAIEGKTPPGSPKPTSTARNGSHHKSDDRRRGAGSHDSASSDNTHSNTAKRPSLSKLGVGSKRDSKDSCVIS
ncbi:GTPase NRas precursor [Limtongia smithiae]|uniref:GTPase NRas precursor n=1 Tax=Limtongia smithiae TaxID=1125753 RepID=UPI0034CE986A